MEQKNHVFISHAALDREIARRVYDALEAAGIDAWLDQIEIQLGDDWKKRIDEALRSAPVILVLLSNAAINSPYVAAEYRTFLAQNKSLYIALTEPLLDNEIPTRLRALPYIDLSRDFESGMNQLISALKSPSAWQIRDMPPMQTKRKVTLRLKPDQFDADELSKLVSNLVNAGVEDIEVIGTDDVG